MKTVTTPTQSLPFELGEPRSFAGLTILPLYPQSSSVEYIGLDEAIARGLEILEVDEHGVVEELNVKNSLDELVLLYEGEELVGAKQNRSVEWTILAEAHSKLTVPVHCVERGRWAYRSQRFAPAAHAASPELRRHNGQAEVWAEVSALIVGPEAVDPDGRVYAPLVTLGWVAGWTERIGLGTSIVLVPLHNPMHLAKEVATLQELSGGRFNGRRRHGLAQGRIRL